MTFIKQIQVDSNNATGDAFGRLRVAEPYTVFDSKQLYDSAPLFWDDQETVGSGTTSSHSTLRAATEIGVALNTLGTRVRQTFQRFNYQPGKSQYILMTGILLKSGGGADVITKMGIFDENDGIFFEYNGGTLNVVSRSGVSGGPINTTVAQSSWNIDPLDGTGASGLTLDVTKTQILVIDFEWLGVGRVRIGFNIDGVTYYVHEFLNANVATAVYMSTPNLPLRYEISNGGAGAATTMEHICAAVSSEGGKEDIGSIRAYGTQGTPITFTQSTTTSYPILAMRLKTTHIGSTIKLLKQVLYIATDNDRIEWRLLFNPTFSGALSYSPIANSAIEIAPGDGAISITGDGTILDQGFLEAGGATSGTGVAESSISSSLGLGSNIAGTPDVICLAVRPLTASLDAEASITWRELS